jgi:hypothetical protein
MITILYVLQHSLSVLLLHKKSRGFYALFSFIVISIIYIIKTDHYDIPHYIELAKNPFVFQDIGFSYLLSFFYLFTDNEVFVIRLTQCFIVICFLFYGLLVNKTPSVIHGAKFSKKEPLIYTILLIIMSVAFTLGINNGLRQGLSGLLALFFLFFLIEKKYFLALLFSLPTILIHGSGIYFLTLILLLYVFLKLFFFHSYIRIRLSFGLTLASIYIFGIICGLLLSELISFSDVYSQYANKVLLVEGSERLSLPLKLIPIIGIYLISEVIGSKYSVENEHITSIRFLRALFLSLTVTLAFFNGLDELGARMLYYYFLIELAAIIFFWINQNKNAAVFIIFTYTFAINSIHVLAGRIL